LAASEENCCPPEFVLQPASKKQSHKYRFILAPDRELQISMTADDGHERPSKNQRLNHQIFFTAPRQAAHQSAYQARLALTAAAQPLSFALFFASDHL